MLRSAFALLLACAAAPAFAVQPPNPQIDYAGYRRLANETEAYRQTRLLGWDAFTAATREPNVLILDARSERQFAAGHIEGAVNLPLPEFSAERLAEVIGDSDRPILIYCNNNFRNDRPPVILKSFSLALNLSTFVHLVGYGYRNVRELNEVMDMDDPSVRWVTGAAPVTASSSVSD